MSGNKTTAPFDEARYNEEADALWNADYLSPLEKDDLLFHLASEWKLSRTPPITLTVYEIAAGFRSNFYVRPRLPDEMMIRLEELLPHMELVDNSELSPGPDTSMLFGWLTTYAATLRDVLTSPVRERVSALLRKWIAVIGDDGSAGQANLEILANPYAAGIAEAKYVLALLEARA